jgi:hypothetical protein
VQYWTGVADITVAAASVCCLACVCVLTARTHTHTHTHTSHHIRARITRLTSRRLAIRSTCPRSTRRLWALLHFTLFKAVCSCTRAGICVCRTAARVRARLRSASCLHGG